MICKYHDDTETEVACESCGEGICAECETRVMGPWGKMMTVCDDCSQFFRDTKTREPIRMRLLMAFVGLVAIFGVTPYFHTLLGGSEPVGLYLRLGDRTFIEVFRQDKTEDTPRSARHLRQLLCYMDVVRRFDGINGTARLPTIFY